MTDLTGKKLPTVEQVEEIMKDWGKFSVEEFADRFQLDKEMIEATVAYLRKLKRTSDQRTIPVMACYRNDHLESIVRCAGTRHGYW
ncbi:MAG: hypothetical protein ABIK98_00675 [Pseudomonadota bacterium]|uniref:Uncharacterized protein n=1 Tax=Candidatus Desulfatibia profunda TaxID=2841695 RepID=A0A8J6NP58_9BACT|nr:hypothetical protein [Candidatus Desulfatibia profunda]MBL7179712.1 hypothetical protein [Desulfobacterales bacterium]MBU0698231.1 hypothetical protein [Pseudomonadota bacterium]